MFYSLYISLFRWELADPNNRPFIGLMNYVNLFKNPQFTGSLWLTFRFTIISLFITMVLGVLIAILLNQKFFGRNFLRLVTLVPWILPSVVVGTMWDWILNANFGVFNALLKSLNIIPTYVTWLGQIKTAFPALIAVKCWKEIPFVTMMYLASFQTISADLYEAAYIEGVNRFQAFFKITLPLIAPVSVVVLIMQTMWTFRVFDIVYVMTGGGPSNRTMVLAFYAYLENFKFYHLGSGSAVAYIITLIIFIVSVFYVKTINRET